MTEQGAATLPSNVKPVGYRLMLEPDLETFTFKGEETIEVEVVEATSSLTLNAIELDIQTCRMTSSNGNTVAPQATTFDDTAETVTFEFEDAIPTGRARLELEFTGELNDRLRGFYRSRYTDVDGNERYLATTQFEATDARRAFPCWDEPSTKATFDVTLVVPVELEAVSNMPVASETEVRSGVKSVRFEETPVMSTYLLAFIVGDLTSVEQEADGGTLVRVWATRGKEEQCRFALEVSVDLLAYFNDYFGMPYPLPKLDHLAIPDFSAGAMENWGAITYREIALLVDPDNSSVAARQRVAAIISHEMAHMWFGDLVTMEWWDDLWLNESFASWMGDKAVDRLFPEWETWTQFVSNDTNRGLSLDGLKSSHPIEQEVSNPAEIGQLFDAISYSKGASILRMLEDFLEEEPFRRGLHDYLAAHEYANARTEDLWAALGAASGRPVGAIMDTWTKQTGYPAVDVRVDRASDAIAVALTQKRFMYEDILSEGEGDDDATTWQVPIRVGNARDARAASALMEGTETTILFRGPADGWIKVNPLQTGFYRVKYPPEELERLQAPIRDLALPPADRLGIQNDTYALARAGHIPAVRFLDIAQAYVNETDATVCGDLATNLGAVDMLLWDEPSYVGFQAFGRAIFQPIGAQIGWDSRDGEREMDALLRSTVLSQLAGYGDEATLREGKGRFSRYVDDRASVIADIRGVVFGIAARTGDRSTYDTIWELQKATDLAEEKVRLLMALGRFEQPGLLAETLERSLSDDVRVHDTISVLHTVARNRLGRDLAWEFLKDNWAEFDRRYGEGGFGLMSLVSITSAFTSQEKRDDVERFFRDHPTPAAERSIRQSLERISINVAWLERNRDELAA
ncbi:MAG: M1 family metallopeptidase, partial [Chloroflexi bacterium]|nr:M1 family metallopeptidase [Chloroflexota bacterium]